MINLTEQLKTFIEEAKNYKGRRGNTDKLHLSDEMVGLPINEPIPNPVPVPTAFLLFGSALLGLTGRRRRENADV